MGEGKMVKPLPMIVGAAIIAGMVALAWWLARSAGNALSALPGAASDAVAIAGQNALNALVEAPGAATDAAKGALQSAAGEALGAAADLFAPDSGVAESEERWQTAATEQIEDPLSLREIWDYYF